MNFFVYTASVLVKKSKNHRNGSRIFPFSHDKCGKTADLAIAYWKKQIVLCPYINDNNKEWCKEFTKKVMLRLVHQQPLGRSITTLMTQFS